MSRAPRRWASVAASQPTLPAPMTTTRPAAGRGAGLGRLQEVEGGDRPLDAGDGRHAGLLGPGGEHEVVVILAQLGGVGRAERLLQVDVRQHPLDAFELGVDHLARDAAVGDDARELSAEAAGQLVHRGLVALEAQLPGDREPRRTAADDRDALAAERGQLREAAPGCWPGRSGSCPPAPCRRSAGCRTACTGSGRGSRRPPPGRGCRPAPGRPPRPAGLRARAASGAARGCRSGSRPRTGRRRSGSARPGRTAAAPPVVMTGMALRSMRLRSPINPPWPSSASQTSRWKAATARTDRPAFSFGRRATSSCQDARSESVRCISRRPIFLRNDLQAGLQPVPVGVPDRRQAGVGLAEARVRTAEEHLAADHADQRPVAEHVFGVLGLQAADHGDAAGHELAEVVPDRAQHPELGRLEAGVVLGHGHAAGADVAGDADAPLGHAVGRAVAGVAVHDDLRPGVEPAHVVGDRAEDLDDGVREPHRAQPLAGVPRDPDLDRVGARAPQAAADPVLAEGLDLDAAVPVRDRLLNLLLQDAGAHALARLAPRDGVHGGDFVSLDFGSLIWVLRAEVSSRVSVSRLIRRCPDPGCRIQDSE